MGYVNEKLSSPHAMLELVHKGVPGTGAVNIFGFNRTLGTTFQTLWNQTGAYVFPSSAVTMSAVSSSASDTMQVLISGLDADYKSVAAIVTLNGTTPVTTTQTFLRINSALILSGNNVGNITISNGGTTYAYIEATIGITQACLYTVPAGFSLYLFRLDFTSGTVNNNKYLSIRNVVTTSTGRTLRVAEATFQNSQVSFDRQVPFRIAEKTDFQFEGKSSSSTNELSAFIEGILVEN
jgi:hypothetical protein